MALKWQGFLGSSPVRLTVLASRDKINRTPEDVCYDLLRDSCHVSIAFAYGGLQVSRQDSFPRDKTFSLKAKPSFSGQNFLVQGKTFFPKTRLSFPRQTFFLKAKLSFSGQSFLSQGKTFFLKAKLSFSGQSFLSRGKMFFLKTKLLQEGTN